MSTARIVPPRVDHVLKGGLVEDVDLPFGHDLALHGREQPLQGGGAEDLDPDRFPRGQAGGTCLPIVRTVHAVIDLDLDLLIAQLEPGLDGQPGRGVRAQDGREDGRVEEDVAVEKHHALPPDCFAGQPEGVDVVGRGVDVVADEGRPQARVMRRDIARGSALPGSR